MNNFLLKLCILTVFLTFFIPKTWASKHYIYQEQQLIAVVDSSTQSLAQNFKNYLSNFIGNIRISERGPTTKVVGVSHKHFWILTSDLKSIQVQLLDLDKRASTQLIKQYCRDQNCYKAIESQNITAYWTSNLDGPTTSGLKHLSLVKTNQSFYFDSQYPDSIKLKLLMESDFDLAHNGTGEVIWSSSKEVKSEHHFGSFLVKDSTRLFLWKSPISTDQLSYLKKHTNSQCVFFKLEHELFVCSGEQVSKSSPSLNVILKFKNFSSPVLMKSQAALTQNQIELLFNDYDLEYISDVSVRLAQQNPKFERVLNYTKNKSSIAHFSLDKNPELLKHLHQFSLGVLNPDHYEVYQQNDEEQMGLILSKDLIATQTSKLISRGRFFKGVKAKFNLINRNNEISAPTNLAYLRRNKISSLSTFSSDIQWWPNLGHWGLRGGISYFQQENEAVSGLGNVSNFKSTMLDYELLASYRMSPFSIEYNSIVTVSAGYKSRAFGVESNSSIGSLNYSLYILRSELEYHIQKYKIFSQFEYGILQDAGVDFQSTQSFNSSSGSSYSLRLGCSKDIGDKLDLSLFASFNKDQLELNNSEVSVKNTQVGLALQYRWGE